MIDLLIIGCGLAGASMAWQAHLRGLSIAIVDREESDSCSMVAAGLVTPITGSRAAASWEWDFFYSDACQFYSRIEELVERKLWYSEPTIRIYRSEQERNQFESKWYGQEPKSRGAPQARTFDTTYLNVIRAPWGGCEMLPAARLDTVAYLNATRDYFRECGVFHRVNIDCDSILVDGFRVRSDKLGVEASAMVLCQGVESRKNRWFSELPLHPARGDVLTIDAPRGVKIDRVLHHDLWVVPTDNGQLKIGATYDRHFLDGIVDDRPEVLAWREELIKRWSGLLSPELSGDCKVKNHQAAVRPASYDRHPLIGRHRDATGVYCLNGLGSKGSLMAPALSRVLLSTILNREPLPPQLDWQRLLRKVNKQ